MPLQCFYPQRAQLWPPGTLAPRRMCWAWTHSVITAEKSWSICLLVKKPPPARAALCSSPLSGDAPAHAGPRRVAGADTTDLGRLVLQ